MAANCTAEILETQNRNYDTGTNEIKREEVQAAIAKAKELRALHSALVQGNSPANFRLLPSGSSPVPHLHPQLSAQDYPVFTPSYEDEPLPGYQQIQLESRTLSECWNEYRIGEGNIDETLFLPQNMNASSRNGFASLESHCCPAEDQKSIGGSFSHNPLFPRNSPRNDFSNSSRRNSLGEFRSYRSSSCNKCNPAVISKNSNILTPLSDSHSSLQSQQKTRGLNFSQWFPFSGLKKKNKSVNSPNRMQPEERFSQAFSDLGILSIEALKKQLMEANESRDAALMEVTEMKSSMGDLKQKLERLETYCGELKEALRQAMTTEKDSHVLETNGNLNSINDMPVSEEVMVEGFLQIVSEARLSVKQYCKTLVTRINETDGSLMENLNSLLQPHKLSANSKYTKAVLYHLEAIINQTLFQDFENIAFQKNGSPKLLDPHQDRQAQFQSYVSLRNLSWSEVLRKGTKCYSEEFSKFCDQKMSCIISTLNWTRPWPENLLQSFFVAAKCIWLLHLLAFSFNPPLGILRVEENRNFDSHFMEDVFMHKRKSSGPSRVKVMVMPGFYVQERVLRCKVLCRYKSVT
ncbi:hypothetical protein RHSIM_Rhsim13G0224900 [Rhododendron simsii]|uniref:GIL1/IRKI C-terminal domain-containing protein n=1 Tax=Rhododendron simsii TaxID=118357 RepID=A0A834L6L0_RHOSS|nr:hypothetical protein RHSIM_Rhsim13G0224900 [Rhododendron simsii]